MPLLTLTLSLLTLSLLTLSLLTLSLLTLSLSKGEGDSRARASKIARRDKR